MATWWPLVRRHWLQWHAVTGASGPRISYSTPPQRQWPLWTSDAE